MSDTDAIRHGRCLCGDVTFEVMGRPLWIAHCHCESCRRATSSPFTTYVGVRSEAVRFGGGPVKTYASSPEVERGFCPRCGSPISYRSAKWPGEVHLFAATFEDAAALEPRAHVNVADGLPWADLHDQLPRFDRFGAGVPPSRIGPKT